MTVALTTAVEKTKDLEQTVIYLESQLAAFRTSTEDKSDIVSTSSI
jgi:hypothetical protein